MITIYKRQDYTIEIPDLGTHLSIAEIQDIVTRSGSHFFDRDTMKSFRSKVDDETHAAADGWYFITSEKHVSHFAGINEPRLYTVRCLRVVTDEHGGRPTLRLLELEGFQAFATLSRARTAARRAASAPRPACSACRLRLSADAGRVVCQECTDRADRVVARQAEESAAR